MCCTNSFFTCISFSFARGPGPGRHQDNWLVQMSRLRQRLRPLFDLTPANFAPYARVGGDLIFAANSEVSRGILLANAAQQRENAKVNGPRTSVEWVFTIMETLGQNILNKRAMKVFQGPPLGPMFHCLAFFYNCHCCLEGNQINTYYGSSSPSLEQYLRGGVTPQHTF